MISDKPPRRPAPIAAALAVAALALSALASIAPAAPAGNADMRDSGRYAFVPVHEGALRLDRESGAVALCAGEIGQRSCVTVSGAAQPSAIRPDAALRRPEAIKRVSALAVRAMRRLIDRVAGIKRDRRADRL